MSDVHFPTLWTDRLAFDVALMLEGSGEPMKDLLARHSLSSAQMLDIRTDPVFARKVREYRDEIVDKGLTFRLKARAQAEELLTTSWILIHDPDVSPAVKADLIKSTVKWADLEPRRDQVDAGNAAGGIQILINLPDTRSTRIVDGGAADVVDNAV